MKKIAGVLLVILGIVMFIHAIWWSPFNFFVPNAKNLEENIPMEDIDSIRLDVTSEDLTILPSDGESLKVMAIGRDLNHVDFSVNQDNNEAKIELRPKWYSFSNQNELKLLVYVPRNQMVKLHVKAASRVVQIGNHKGAKWNISNLNTEFSSGTCTLHNLQINNLNYNGTSTDVIVNRVQAKQANMETFSGNMNISHYAGPINLASTSGNIRIQLDKLIGDVHTKIISGNMDMYVPSSSSFTLNADLQSGKVTSTYPIDLKQSSPRQTTAKSGSGDYKIETEILNGDFIIH
jgi:lia operon protein LiaG